MTPNYLLTTHGNPNTTSARFAGICTMDAINPLLNEGWNMVSTESKRYRKTERGPYVSHLVKLTHPDLKGTSEFQPQLVLKNGNDGTSAFALMAGVFRSVCANGMYAGALASAIKVRHVGDKTELSELIRKGAEEIRAYVPKLADQVETWNYVTLDNNQVKLLFSLAAVARWGREEAARRNDLSETAAYITRRREDEGRSLWQTFNRAQESFTAGTVGWARRGIRALRSIDQSIRFNRTLWNIADVTARGKIADLHLACTIGGADIHLAAKELALQS